MDFWSRSAKRWSLLSSLLFAATPAGANDSYGASYQEHGEVGQSFRAYRAGIGHTEAPPPNVRPLDGSLRPAPYRVTSQPAPATEPRVDWSGTYLGATVGGLASTTDFNGAFNHDVDTSSYLVTGHIGTNSQIGGLVFGPELDLSLTNATDSKQISGTTTKTELDWLASARLRAGYAFDNVLLYGTAGVAVTTTDVDISAFGFQVQSKEFHTGYVVGGGAEMELVDGINARVEALHYGFSGDTIQTPSGTSNLDLDVTTVRAGLSLKFN